MSNPIPSLWRCNLCGVEKPPSEFEREGGWSFPCQECQQAVWRECERADRIHRTIWKPDGGDDAFYEASHKGEVRAVCTRTPIKKRMNAGGYWQLAQTPSLCVHRVVAAAFYGPRPEWAVVNHKDLNPSNNRAVNLEYVTPGENTRHAQRAYRILRGENIHFARLTDLQVLEIRRGGGVPEELAERFGVSVETIKSVQRGDTWKHLL